MIPPVKSVPARPEAEAFCNALLLMIRAEEKLLLARSKGLPMAELLQEEFNRAQDALHDVLCDTLSKS